MRITESQLRRIVREEARRLVLREAAITDPFHAARALVASLGQAGAEELADDMYAAVGSDARAAEARFVAELRAVGAGPLADDPGWSSEVYLALTDLVNPWDARRPVRESLLPGDEPYVVIGNEGRGVQVLWPSSAEPEALSREEAEATAERLNRTLPSARSGRMHWHFKPLAGADQYVSSGQEASYGLSRLRASMEEM